MVDLKVKKEETASANIVSLLANENQKDIEKEAAQTSETNAPYVLTKGADLELNDRIKVGNQIYQILESGMVRSVTTGAFLNLKETQAYLKVVV